MIKNDWMETDPTVLKSANVLFLSIAKEMWLGDFKWATIIIIVKGLQNCDLLKLKVWKEIF